MSAAVPSPPVIAAPGGRWRYFSLAVGMAATLAGFLIWNNAPYLFHTLLYEQGDPAANSLSVLRAEHFGELYGAYSRWLFHHPGPAFFYALALGEILLYQTFHLVPTPYNAQVIVVIILTGGFLAGGLAVAARWVRGTLFLPLALLFAALHFTAVQPDTCLLYPWTAYVVVMPFFALLMAAASVGAGQGDDLPLLILAGGFLVHTHVAQPFFVGPLALLAYAGLARACATRPWRVFPRAHGFAAALLAAYALPPLVDLCSGANSNFAHVLLHLRTHQGQHQPWRDALYCFLRFGAYTPSRTLHQISPGNVSGPQIAGFLENHARMACLWLGALLVPPAAWAWHRRQTAPAAAAFARWRFLGSLALFWLLAAALTVAWDHLQDGELFYFNSWFTYAVYYALAVLAAGAVADRIETILARRRHPAAWTALAAGLCLLAAGGFVGRRLGHFRTHYYDEDDCRAEARSVARALAARPDAPPTKLLLFPQIGWGCATGVAALLTREHQPWIVPPDWAVMFGNEHAPATLVPSLAAETSPRLPYDVWFLVPANSVDARLAARFPLIGDYTLLPGGRELDPADAAITFVGNNPNADLFVVTGDSTPDADAPYVWSVGPAAVFSFVPRPVPAGSVVEIGCDFADAFLVPGKCDAQRLALRFNGIDLGTRRVDAGGPRTLEAEVPAAVWNARATAIFTMGFPDAVSPLQVKLSPDYRPLAFAMRKITFRLRAAPAPAAP